MTIQLKSGHMLRYKKRIFGKDWREEYVVLYDNSALVWLKEKDKPEPEGLLILKDAPELMACGQYTVRVPNRPDLPDGYTVSQLLAFGSRDRQAVYWFLCKSEDDALEWLTAISNTLPPPPPPAKTATSSDQSEKDATNQDDGSVSAVLTTAFVNTEWGSGWGWDGHAIFASSNDVMCFAQNDLGDVDFGCDGGGDACDFDGCAGFVAF